MQELARWWTSRRLAVSLAAGAVLVAAVVVIATSGSPDVLRARIDALTSLEVLLLLQIPVLLLATAVHELGHMLAAIAAGFEPTGIRVGPLRVTRTPAGWRPRITWGSLPGGEVQVDPVRPDRLRRRHALMVAGGPAAHLVLAAAVLGVAVEVNRLALWLSVAVIAAGAVSNLVPVRFGRGRRWTDGRWLLTWLSQPERAAQRVGLSALQRVRAAGRRPRDWDRCWVELAAGPSAPADPVQAAGSLLAYFWALDRGEVERAAGLLGRVFSARRLLSDRAGAGVAVEVAFFVAHCLGNHDLAARLLAADLLARAAGADVERARAAMHLAAGRPGAALAACERALAALDRPNPRRLGEVALQREQLTTMRDRARRQLTAGQAAPATESGPAVSDHDGTSNLCSNGQGADGLRRLRSAHDTT